MTKRIAKVNSLLQKEISQVILKEIDFDNALVTIIGVKTSPGFFESKVLITVLPQGKEEEILSILKNNIYDIQKMINKRLKMRPVPKIRFEIDEGMKNFYKIDKISKDNSINHDKKDL